MIHIWNSHWPILSNYITSPLYQIYNKGLWSRLCFLAGTKPDFSDGLESKIHSSIKNKWLSTLSYSYFKWINELAKNKFEYKIDDLNNDEKVMLLMFYYDIWQGPSSHVSLHTAIKSLSQYPTLTSEIIEITDLLMDECHHEELDVTLPYAMPLKVHSRYTRDQILAAVDLHTFEKKSSNREGIAYNELLKTEILFINLVKSEADFSPTTMYEDYAINEDLFHWQSQNIVGPDTPKGSTYINHIAKGIRILLFVREQNKNESGQTNGYVFLGEGTYVEHYGSKPMSIKWALSHPMPHYLWSFAAKLVAG